MATPSVSVCEGTQLAGRTDGTTAISNCLAADGSSLGFSISANVGATTSCLGSTTITRRLGDVDSHKRVIKVTAPAGRDFIFQNGETAIQVLAEAPNSPCVFDTASSGGVGTVKTGLFSVRTNLAGDYNGHLCSGGAVSEKGAGSNSIVSLDASSTATCTGGLTAPGQAVKEFAFVYMCPELTVDRASDVQSFVRVGSIDNQVTTSADAYAVVDVKCAAEIPSNDFCVRFTYCTPFSASSNAGTFANVCAATSTATRDSLLASCGTGDTFPCTTTAGSVVSCSTCPNVLNLPGMTFNSFRVQAASQAQIDSVVASVRAGSVVNVPAYATVETSTDKCATFTTIPCAGASCAVPSGIYPSADQKSGVVASVDAETLTRITEAYADDPTFEVNDVDVRATLLVTSSVSIAAPVPVPAAPVTTRSRAADAAQATTQVVITSPCDNSLAGSVVVAPTPGGATASGTGSATSDIAACCEGFYTYLRCDLEIPSYTSCSCGGSATCPPEISCPSSSSNKSLLHLLWLLCIPFWILILCSIIIACCLIRRRKRGWQERQLATFDPEPHPAAPPPPVNMYEECPAYAHHDGASGYSDVHHNTDEYYSQA